MVQQVQKNKKSNTYDGFVALVSVIIVMFIAVTVVVTMLSLTIDSAGSFKTDRDARQAVNYADLCAEVALNKLKININYTGSETITLSYGSCNIAIITGVGNTNRTISTTGLSGNVTKRVTVVVTTVNPTTVISSWQEVQ